MRRQARRHRDIAGLAAVVAACSPAAPAQVRSNVPDNSIRYVRPWEGAPNGFQRVDEAVVDRDYLAASLYDVNAQASLNLPTGFDDLYLGPDGRYYRFNGAVGISFPRSQYEWFQLSRREYVEVPVVPAGTIFHIGPPILGGVALPSEPIVNPDAARARASSAIASTASAVEDLRASLRVDPSPIGSATSDAEQPAEPAAKSPPPPTTVATNEAYRRMRLAALIESVRGVEPAQPPAMPELPPPAPRAGAARAD